jgi:hypothetical protein
VPLPTNGDEGGIKKMIGPSLEKLSIVFDAIHRTNIHGSTDVIFLPRVGRLLINIIIGGVVAVHEILQSIREANAAPIARARDKIPTYDIFLKPDCD